MQIELIGCTGAGKSTLLNGMLQACYMRGLEAFKGDDFVLKNVHLNWVNGHFVRTLLVDFFSLTESLWNWRKYSDLYKLIFRTMLSLQEVGLFERLNIIRNTLKQIGIHEIICRLSSDQQIVLLDEGSLHTAHYLFVHLSTKLSITGLLSFVKLVPLPDVVIFLRPDEEILIERTLLRGHKRIPGGSRASTELFIKRAVMTFDKLTQDLTIASRLLLVNGDHQIRVMQNGQGYLSQGIIPELLRAGLDLIKIDHTDKSNPEFITINNFKDSGRI